MDSETFREIANALHGDKSNGELILAVATEFDLNPRNVERMLAGTRDVPNGIASEAIPKLKARFDHLSQKMQGLARESA
jgi:hypothetical protein